MKDKAIDLMFIILCFTKGVQTALTSRPQNVTHVAGSAIPVTFNCGTTLKQSNGKPLPVTWKFSNQTTIRPLQLYDGGDLVGIYKGKLAIKESHEGLFALVILEVTLSDAGSYRCIDNTGIGDEAVAELFVVSEDPHDAVSGSVSSSSIISKSTITILLAVIVPTCILIVLITLGWICWKRHLIQKCKDFIQKRQILAEDVRLLTRVSDDFCQNPVEIRTLPGREGKPVYGIAVLFNEVFLLRELTSQLDVYDCRTFQLRRTLVVADLKTPQDLASSEIFNCLYIADGGRNGRFDYCVHRIKQNGDIATNWPTQGDPDGISVTHDGSNVVICYYDTRQIQEFTTHGDFVREIRLPDFMVHPWQAVEWASHQFVIIHGWGERDPLNGMCFGDLVECDIGSDDSDRVVSIPPAETLQLTKYFGGGEDQNPEDARIINYPRRLVIDHNGFILVAVDNDIQVLLFNPQLEYVRELIPPDENRGWRPVALCLDERRGRLFLANNECTITNSKSQVRVFQVKNING